MKRLVRKQVEMKWKIGEQRWQEATKLEIKDIA
jgi:hypothetical protein